MLEDNQNLEIVDVRKRQGLRRWLEKYHASASGAWLMIYKAKSRMKGISYEEAVQEALSFGWIDSKMSPLDENRYRLMFTPRKPGSIWAKSNKERIEKLIQQGFMTETGLKTIEAAKANGSWYTFDSVQDFIVPPDLAEALGSNPEAKKTFDYYNDSVKKQVLWFIASAKQPETRRHRMNRIIELMNRGGKITELD